MQKLKKLIKLSNLSNFQPFASRIEGNIRHEKLRNCWVARNLMSRTPPVKFGVFRREFLRNHSTNWTQIFRENVNCYALSMLRAFILLASSDSDTYMLMKHVLMTAHRWLTWFCTGLRRGRSWVRDSDQSNTQGLQITEEKCAAFVISSTNG